MYCAPGKFASALRRLAKNIKNHLIIIAFSYFQLIIGFIIIIILVVLYSHQQATKELLQLGLYFHLYHDHTSTIQPLTCKNYSTINSERSSMNFFFFFSVIIIFIINFF